MNEIVTSYFNARADLLNAFDEGEETRYIIDRRMATWAVVTGLPSYGNSTLLVREMGKDYSCYYSCYQLKREAGMVLADIWDDEAKWQYLILMEDGQIEDYRDLENKGY